MSFGITGGGGGGSNSDVTASFTGAAIGTFAAISHAMRPITSTWMPTATAVEVGLRFTAMRSGTAIGLDSRTSGGSLGAKNASRMFAISD